MPQYTFTSEKEFIEEEIDYLAKKDNRTRSEIINALLHQAVKERNRHKEKRLRAAKKNYS